MSTHAYTIFMSQGTIITIEQLIDINQKIRDIPDEKRGFHVPKTENTRMQAPPLLAPKKETQGKVLAYMLDSLPKIREPKYRASAAYYTLVLLHLFRDGNGRTARTIYGLLINNNKDYSTKGVSKEFEKENNLIYAKKLEEILMFALLDELQYQEGEPYPELRGRQYKILSNTNSVMSGDFALTVLGGAYNYTKANETLSAFESFNVLSDEDKTRVCYAFLDHNSGPVCISGLSVLKLHSKKHSTLQKWLIDIDEECADWSTEDFLQYADIVEDTKEKILTMAIDAFVRPDNYRINSLTIAEIATNPSLLAELK